VALKAIRKSKNFEPLAVSFKRIRKILEKANVVPGDARQANPELFESAAERELYSAVRAAATRVQTQKRAGKFRKPWRPLPPAKSSRSVFRPRHGDDGKRTVRNNRLALLAELLPRVTTRRRLF